MKKAMSAAKATLILLAAILPSMTVAGCGAAKSIANTLRDEAHVLNSPEHPPQISWGARVITYDVQNTENYDAGVYVSVPGAGYYCGGGNVEADCDITLAGSQVMIQFDFAGYLPNYFSADYVGTVAPIIGWIWVQNGYGPREMNYWSFQKGKPPVLLTGRARQAAIRRSIETGGLPLGYKEPESQAPAY